MGKAKQGIVVKHGAIKAYSRNRSYDFRQGGSWDDPRVQRRLDRTAVWVPRHAVRWVSKDDTAVFPVRLHVGGDHYFELFRASLDEVLAWLGGSPPQ